MSRFQAQTNAVLDEELEAIREELGLEASQKADLLREVTAIAGWVVRQAGRGRAIEARRGDEVERLEHAAVERLRRAREVASLPRLALTDDEARRLASALDAPFAPSPALQASLARLADPRRAPPRVRWPRSGA
ncbi:MAG: hypothetical protein U0325_27310 [Polyangiales bacterium]